MGSGPVDGVADPGWFEFYDDTIEVDPGSVADRAFLAGLRARAVSHAWPCDPDDTWTYHAIDDDQHLLRVGVWLHVWLTCGLEFDGTRIVGGDVYSGIPFDLEGLHPDAAMEYSGSVEFLVERAGEWFEWLLSWPIERREWFENGELVFGESVLASTERKLTAQMRPQPARPPDRVTLVRGVREPGADRDGGRKRWSFGERRPVPLDSQPPVPEAVEQYLVALIVNAGQVGGAIGGTVGGAIGGSFGGAAGGVVGGSRGGARGAARAARRMRTVVEHRTGISLGTREQVVDRVSAAVPRARQLPADEELVRLAVPTGPTGLHQIVVDLKLETPVDDQAGWRVTVTGYGKEGLLNRKPTRRITDRIWSAAVDSGL